MWRYIRDPEKARVESNPRRSCWVAHILNRLFWILPPSSLLRPRAVPLSWIFSQFTQTLHPQRPSNVSQTLHRHLFPKILALYKGGGGGENEKGGALIIYAA